MRAALNLAVPLATTLSIMLAGCGKLEQNDPQKSVASKAQSQRQKTACASTAGYDRLKGLLFDQAIAQHRGEYTNLDILADYSTIRMEDPVVVGWDPALDVTTCKGRLILEMPPGAERGLDGERHLQAEIGYTAQSAADGNGLVYRLNGGEPIVARLAAFNLTSAGFRPSPAIDDAHTETAPAAPVVVAQASKPTPAPTLLPSPAPPPERAERRQPDRVTDRPPPVRTRPSDLEDSGPQVASASRDAGEARVRGFYDALGAGNGGAASAQVVPEKRSSAAFSPAAISRFYGRLPEPIRLTQVVPLAGGAYRVSYRYSAGRSHCAGSAIVRVVEQGGSTLIRSIRALNGC